VNNLFDDIDIPARSPADIFTEVSYSRERAYRADRLDGSDHAGGKPLRQGHDECSSPVLQASALRACLVAIGVKRTKLGRVKSDAHDPTRTSRSIRRSNRQL
jgi:hypothetical protein